MSNPKHESAYRKADDDECGVCADGMIRIVTRYRCDDFVRPEFFARWNDERRAAIVAEYGSLERVPRGFDRPIEERGTAAMMACLCRLGRLKVERFKIRSVGEVYTDVQIAELWPNGVPTGVPRPERALGESGVAPAHQRFTLASYANRFDDKTARRYAKYSAAWIKTNRNDRSDLLLYGPQGTGKTGLAVALLRACVEQGESVQFWNVRELAIEWRATFRTNLLDGQDTEHDMLRKVIAVDVLVLDEVTGAKMSEFVEDTITLIVDRRQKDLRPTILTLNVAADTIDDNEALAMMLGPTLFDRLRERSQSWPMKGDSRRQTYGSKP